jgi:hypothetical protein
MAFLLLLLQFAVTILHFAFSPFQNPRLAHPEGTRRLMMTDRDAYPTDIRVEQEKASVVGRKS